MTLRLEIPGTPRGKGRHRTARIGEFLREYTDKETASYENLVKLVARSAMNGQGMLPGALCMDVTAIFGVPSSWSGKKRQRALAGGIRPATKPDCDNIVKILADACNGIVYADDKAIVEATIRKVYGEQPKVIVEVGSLV